MSKQFNLIEFLSIALQIRRTSRFGRNRLMKRINGSDETHDRELLPLSRGRWIPIGRLRCVFRRFNQSCYNSSDRCSDLIIYITIRRRIVLRHIPPLLKWRSRVMIFCTTQTPLMLQSHLLHWPFDRDAIGRSRSRHVTCALKINWNFDFKLEKSIFNSRKSLEIL